MSMKKYRTVGCREIVQWPRGEEEGDEGRPGEMKRGQGLQKRREEDRRRGGEGRRQEGREGEGRGKRIKAHSRIICESGSTLSSAQDLCLTLLRDHLLR